MGSFAVIPQQPQDQLTVEQSGIEEQILVVIEELFLKGTVESLHMGVHLWRLRVRVPVDLMELSELLVKVSHELRAVVSQHMLKRIGKDLTDDLKDFPGRLRAVTVGRPGKREAGIEVCEGDPISPQPVQEQLHRIKGPTVASRASVKTLRLSFPLDLLSYSLAIGSYLHGNRSHLVRSLRYDSADGPGLRTTQAPCITQRLEQKIELLFA
jgi:hypothetical protein